jgi:hypothetical protein
MQPVQHLRYGSEDLEQQRYRRQLVLHELRSCEQLVEALANWRGSGSTCEQAEYLYDILGGWLKSELYKTIKGIESRNSQKNGMI